jgi:hypothetical protein
MSGTVAQSGQASQNNLQRPSLPQITRVIEAVGKSGKADLEDIYAPAKK